MGTRFTGLLASSAPETAALMLSCRPDNSSPRSFLKEILPNGNIITANWQGQGPGNGGSGIQILEFEPGGNLVWFWKQDPTIFSSIQGVMVVDGKDPLYLHVQETSADGTWQPVVPTP